MDSSVRESGEAKAAVVGGHLLHWMSARQSIAHKHGQVLDLLQPRERQRWIIPRKLTHPLELVRFGMVHRYTYLWYPLQLIQEDLLSVVYHQR